MLEQQAVDFAVAVHDDALGEQLVIDAADPLEDVAEGAVAQVVQQGGDEADRFLLGVDGEGGPQLVQDPPGRLHHAQAVAVAAVVGAGVGEAGQAELADAAQPLELGGVEQAEQQRVRRPLRAEGDHVVDRVADDLFGHNRCQGPGGTAGLPASAP